MLIRMAHESVCVCLFLDIVIAHSFLNHNTKNSLGHPWCLSGKESTCQCRRPRFDPWVRKIPWRRAWQPTPVFLPGKSCGQTNNNDDQWVWKGECVYLMLLGIHSMRVNLVAWSVILLEIDSSFILVFYVYLIYLENTLMHGVNWGSKWKRIQLSCYVLNKARAFPVDCDASFSIYFVLTYRVYSLISPVGSHTTTTLI